MSKKHDEHKDSLYLNLEKSLVYQESRVFNQSPVMIRKCRMALTKVRQG